MNPMQAWLELADGNRVGLAERLTIGRLAVNDLALANRSVSRSHAQVTRDPDGRYRLTDLNSANGTFLNGRKIASEPLFDGAQVQLGDERLLFRQPGGRGRGLTRGPVPIDSTQVFNYSDVVRGWFGVADIVSFSSVLRARPEAEVQADLRDWGEAMTKIVRASGGELNKKMGDGLFYVWRGDTPAAQVGWALGELLAYHRRSPLRFRFILHLGEAAFDGAEYVSRDVNLAFRAEKIASKHGVDVMVSAAARAPLANLAFQHLGDFPIDDFPDPIAFYTVPPSP